MKQEVKKRKQELREIKRVILNDIRDLPDNNKKKHKELWSQLQDIISEYNAIEPYKE